MFLKLTQAFKPGAFAEPEELREFLKGRVAHLSLPECWAVVAEISKTSVGKQDKKAIRALQAEGSLRMRSLVGL